MINTRNVKFPHKFITDDIAQLKTKKIAILGATGQIGRRLLSILARYDFPLENITLTSQEVCRISYHLKTIETKIIDQEGHFFDQFDVVFNCMPNDTIKQYIGQIWDSKCIIIDKSSAFRMGNDVPLVVPEVNGDLVNSSRLIASPNCITVPLVMALHAVWSKITHISHISVSTYQSVSGAGNQAMSALLDETKRTFFEQKVIPQFFSKQIAFNAIPQIGEYDAEYSTDEEVKIEQESNKILSHVIPGLEKLPMSITAVRVPILMSHSIAVHIACKCESLPQVETALNSYPGVQYVAEGQSVSAVESAYEDHVYISRTRRTTAGIAMWITCDNLAKGGALNGFQIAMLKINSMQNQS